MSTIIDVGKQLRLEDFKTWLYAGLVDIGQRDLLPRVEVQWGQPQIVFSHIDVSGIFCGVWVFDREKTGEPLVGYVFSRQVPVLARDCVIVTIINW